MFQIFIVLMNIWFQIRFFLFFAQDINILIFFNLNLIFFLRYFLETKSYQSDYFHSKGGYQENEIFILIDYYYYIECLM